MTYRYINENRLEQPINYMYSEYEGPEFFDYYFNNRISFLSRILNKNNSKLNKRNFIDSSSSEIIHHFIKDFSLVYSERLNFFIKSEVEIYKLNVSFSPKNNKQFFDKSNIYTEDLILEIIKSLIFKKNIVVANSWILNLLRFFEIKKKLPICYIERKASSDIINDYYTYCIFAFVLELFYFRTKKLYFLNTLLKVCDLILSLPFEKLSKIVTNGLLENIVLSELIIVENLLEKGKCFDFK